MTSEESLRRAVRTLRERLKLDQTSFAARIGKSFQMVRKYETEKAPRGEALAPLAAIAIDCGFADLAESFRSALLEDLGPDVLRVLQWEPAAKAPKNSSKIEIPPALEDLVRKFIEFMQSTRGLQQDQALRVLLPSILTAFNEDEPVRIAKKRSS